MNKLINEYNNSIVRNNNKMIHLVLTLIVRGKVHHWFYSGCCSPTLNYPKINHTQQESRLDKLDVLLWINRKWRIRYLNPDPRDHFFDPTVIQVETTTKVLKQRLPSDGSLISTWSNRDESPLSFYWRTSGFSSVTEKKKKNLMSSRHQSSPLFSSCSLS